MYLLQKSYLSNQVTILHMAKQLSCFDMCKIVTWLDLTTKLQQGVLLQGFNNELIHSK